MQYGLLIVKNTDNIGDDIQTFAQKRFLPQVDCFIDRQSLDTFYPSNIQYGPVAVIMNAWYMYQKFNWPPSPFIHPLLVSMHITQNDYFGIGTAFLDGVGGEYLKQYEPVGARDESTLAILKQKGIDAYLSGCMTLTITLDKEKAATDKVFLVDVDAQTERIIKQQFPNENYVSVTHNVDYYHSNIGYEERMEKVEALLTDYQNAKCVITTRLHVALPCLALKTPVLLLYRDAFKDRISSFLPLLYYEKFENLKAGINYNIANPPENKSEYLIIRSSLENICENFIQNSMQIDSKIDETFFENWMNYYAKTAIWQKNLLSNAEVSFRATLNENAEWISMLETAKKWNEEQVENYKTQINEIYIYNMRTWKAIQKYRDFMDNTWLGKMCSKLKLFLK